jgi:cell division septum initiation protein DivIVA
MNTSARYIKMCAKSSFRSRSVESSAEGSAERGSRMSSTPVSSHGFGAVRGRGYCPEQVEAFADALSLDRDAAWERAARLTVLARDMEYEAVQLHETVAQLAPQTYEELGEGARHLFQVVQEEADAVRERARQEVQRLVEAAQAYATGVLDAAQAHADSVRADADECANQRLQVARAEADEIRIGARRAVKEGRGESLGVLRELRQRATVKLAEQAKEFAERWDEVEQAEAERGAAHDARGAGRVARAEAELAEAKRAFTEEEELAHQSQEEANARAAEILAAARLREEQIARETEQVLRKHGERSDEMQLQMDNVRNSLTALTGSASGE